MLRHVLPVVSIFLFTQGIARSADPLDYMPKTARAAVVVDQPRKLAETITHLEAFSQAQALPQIRQLYDTPTTRHLLKLLEFAEKELGARWPELLHQVAGNGLAVGLEFGSDPAPAIAIASGTDEKQVEKAFELGMQLLREEVTRQGGGKEAFSIVHNRGVTTAHLGGDFHFARVGSVILVSNNADYLSEAVSRGQSGKHEDAINKARVETAKLLPKGALGWAWLDFAGVKETKTAKDFFETTRKEFIQTVGAGATIDCLRRSACVVAGLYQEATGFRLRVRMPAGRDGLWPDLALHVPAKGIPGSLPLLEPPGTIYSQSFYLDIGYAWKNRDRLITGDIRKQLDQAQAAANKFLPSKVPLGELIEMWGPYHRVVVADHDKLPYKTEPKQKFPAFAYVATMRDKKLGENVETIVRAAALLGTLQFGLKSSDSEFEGVKIIGYRFPENKELAEDTQGIRFNFEPCFAVVGDDLVVASTTELARKLIVELKKPQGPGASALWQGKVSASYGVTALGGETDALITEGVLNRGVGLAEARQEAAKYLDFIRSLGSARIEIDITNHEYRFDLVWTPGKR